MDGLTFVSRMRDLGENYPPIAEFVDFKIDLVERGHLTGSGLPGAHHYNPMNVVHGGFASTLLDLAVGLVSFTVLDDMSYGVSTTDLNVKYLRSIHADSGRLVWDSSVLHAGKRVVIAEAYLRDGEGRLTATAQSTCLIVRRRE